MILKYYDNSDDTPVKIVSLELVFENIFIFIEMLLELPILYPS